MNISDLPWLLISSRLACAIALLFFLFVRKTSPWFLLIFIPASSADFFDGLVMRGNGFYRIG